MCPRCGHKTAVTDTRTDDCVVIRKRRCKNTMCCKAYETREEINQVPVTLMAARRLKRDGCQSGC